MTVQPGAFTGIVRDRGGAVFNVEAYGGKGDGTTDNAAAFQATIAAIAAAGGGVMVLPRGRYRTTSTLDATAVYGIQVRGAGHGGDPTDPTPPGPLGTQILADFTNAPILRVTGPAHVSGICLMYATQQTTSNTASIGLQLNNLAGATIERVRVWQAHISFGIPQVAFGATSYNAAFNSSFRDLDSQKASQTHFDFRNFSGGGTNCAFDRLYVNGGGSLDFVTPGQSCAYAIRAGNTSGYEFGAISVDAVIVTERIFDVSNGNNLIAIETIRTEAVTVTKDNDGWLAFGGSDTVVRIATIDIKNSRWQAGAPTATFVLRTNATRIVLDVGVLRLHTDCDLGSSGTRRALTNGSGDAGSDIRIRSIADLKPSFSDTVWGDAITTLVQPVREWNGSFVNDERRAGRSANTHRVFVATAIPSSGTFATDDELLMDIITLGKPTAYRCTTGGTPGTWRPISSTVAKNTTASRPTLTASDIGVLYLDTTLDADGKPIWWNGTAWVDATGATV